MQVKITKTFKTTFTEQEKKTLNDYLTLLKFFCDVIVFCEDCLSKDLDFEDDL